MVRRCVAELSSSLLLWRRSALRYQRAKMPVDRRAGQFQRRRDLSDALSFPMRGGDAFEDRNFSAGAPLRLCRILRGLREHRREIRLDLAYRSKALAVRAIGIDVCQIVAGDRTSVTQKHAGCFAVGESADKVAGSSAAFRTIASGRRLRPPGPDGPTARTRSGSADTDCQTPPVCPAVSLRRSTKASRPRSRLWAAARATSSGGGEELHVADRRTSRERSPFPAVPWGGRGRSPFFSRYAAVQEVDEEGDHRFRLPPSRLFTRRAFGFERFLSSESHGAPATESANGGPTVEREPQRPKGAATRPQHSMKSPIRVSRNRQDRSGVEATASSHFGETVCGETA